MVPLAITISANCQVNASRIARILCCACIVTNYSQKLDAEELFFNFDFFFRNLTFVCKDCKEVTDALDQAKCQKFGLIKCSVKGKFTQT